jgi:hypothetical protein
MQSLGELVEWSDAPRAVSWAALLALFLALALGHGNDPSTSMVALTLFASIAFNA